MPERAPFTVQRCPACDTYDPGGRTRCRACGAPGLEPSPVTGAGALVTWTVIRRPGREHAHAGPFAVGLVDLDDGVRITARLASYDPEPRIGDRLVIEDVVEGNPVMVPEPS